MRESFASTLTVLSFPRSCPPQHTALKESDSVRADNPTATLLANSVDLDSASKFSRSQLSRWAAILTAFDECTGREEQMLERYKAL